MRLDKYLCDLNIGTRSEVKHYIRKGQVTVNGIVEKKFDIQIDENQDMISFQGEELSYQKYAYYMLNKPSGVVSATRDNTADTVLDLLKGVPARNLFPVGRLDKDTEGLLLITNDGTLSHRLLSPKKHVDKTYLLHIHHPLSQQDMKQLEEGVDIGDEKITLPAKVNVINEIQITLTICEGRFHQVKRMLQSVGNEVLYLKRIAFGGIDLDETLLLGDYRELTVQELNTLKG